MSPLRSSHMQEHVDLWLRAHVRECPNPPCTPEWSNGRVLSLWGICRCGTPSCRLLPIPPEKPKAVNMLAPVYPLVLLNASGPPRLSVHFAKDGRALITTLRKPPGSDPGFLTVSHMAFKGKLPTPRSPAPGLHPNCVYVRSKLHEAAAPGSWGIVTQRLQCSSFLVMTCFLAAA